MAYRIDGIKYNLDRLPDKEIENIRDRLVKQVAKLLQDVTVLESVLLERQLIKLPFEDVNEEA